MEQELINYLSAGGDLGSWALVLFIWRLDRRLAALEQWVNWSRSGATLGPLYPVKPKENTGLGQ